VISAVTIDDLPDIKPVEIISGVILSDDIRYDKIIGFNKIGIKLPALKNKPGLFEGNALGSQFDGFKAGFYNLIGIFSRMRTTKIKDIPVFFLQETECIIAVFLRKLKSKTLRPDKADRDAFVPEDPQRSPAGGHGIETDQGPGCDEHPVVIEPAEEIIIQRFRAYVFEQGGHLHFCFAANLLFLCPERL